MRLPFTRSKDRLRASTLAALLCATSLFAPASAFAQSLGGLWLITVEAHRDPAGRNHPAETRAAAFTHSGSGLGFRAVRAYQGQLEGGLVRAEAVVGPDQADLPPELAGPLTGSSWRVAFAGVLSPDGARIRGRDQRVGFEEFSTGTGRGARAVKYDVPISMVRVPVKAGFTRTRDASGEPVNALQHGERYRVYAEVDPSLTVEEVPATLVTGDGWDQELALTRDVSGSGRYWSTVLTADAPELARGESIEYRLAVGDVTAVATVRAEGEAPAALFCPRFLFELVTKDLRSEVSGNCARARLPPALSVDGRPDVAAAVRFEDVLRRNPTVAWDLPSQRRITAACPASGLAGAQDALARMQTVAEYLIARRRLTDAAMASLESLAALDALGGMRCEAGAALGSSASPRLLEGVSCEALAQIPGGSAACSTLRSRCPGSYRFNELIEQTEATLEQQDAVKAKLGELRGRNDARSRAAQKQLETVQAMLGGLSPWLGGDAFQTGYDAALEACRSRPSVGEGLCAALRGQFVCEGIRAQARSTSSVIRGQLVQFTQALQCIESSAGQCAMSPKRFREVVARAPRVRSLTASTLAAPVERAIAGFAQGMADDVDCRSELYAASEEQKAAIRDFAVGTALTVATAGVGSVAARVALMAGRARNATLAIDAARAAAIGVRVERAVGLAVDVAELGLDIRRSLDECAEPLARTTAIPSINTAGPQCPGTGYGGPQLTGSYSSCVLKSMAWSLAGAGLVALPAGVSRLMDGALLRRAAAALDFDLSRLSPAQRRALLDVFRNGPGKLDDAGLERALVSLRAAGFTEREIGTLLGRLSPELALVAGRIARGLDGDVVRELRIGEHTLVITRRNGEEGLAICSVCQRLLKGLDAGTLNERAVSDALELGKRLGVEAPGLPEEALLAFKNLLVAAKAAPEPGVMLAAARRLPAAVLAKARPVLASDAFREAIKARPERLEAVLAQLRGSGASAAELYQSLARSNARDLGDLFDILKVPDAVARLSRLSTGRAPESVMSVVRQAAIVSHQAGAAVARSMLRLAEDVANAGPAIGGARRQWALLSDVGVARDRLGTAKFVEYLRSIDFFRTASGHRQGLIRNGRARETANLQDLVSGTANPVNNALEVVGTRWLVESGHRLRVLAGRSDRGALTELPALARDDVVGFGMREIRTPGTTRTIEADTALSIPASRAPNGGGPMSITLDWKNYAENGALHEHDIQKAIEALESGAAKNVLFVSPRPWSDATVRQIRDANRPGLMLAVIEPDAALTRFLDEPIP